MVKRYFLTLLAVWSVSSPALALDPLSATVNEINQAFTARTLTSEELVKAYLARIEAFDKRGPAINALITVNEKALDTARRLDAEREAGNIRGPLHGIPIILKDNFATAGLPTTGGTAALAGFTAPEDGFIVSRLRDAGAVILGKANMSELALSYGWLGYSSVAGITRNPYNLERNASGSSSGSAAAIAAGFAVLATGTDTAGSIRGPAAVDGVVGIKPTRGLTSRGGIIPAALSFDVGGPIARNVSDAAVMLNYMTGVDEDDPATLASAGRYSEDYTASLQGDALGGKRIGVVHSWLGANAQVDATFAHNLATIGELGATLVEVNLPAMLKSLWPLMGPVVDAEFRPQINGYLAALPAAAPNSLEELIAASESEPIKNSATPVNPARIQGYRDSLNSRGLGDPAVLEAFHQGIPAVRQTMRNLMADAAVDALVMPTLPCPASPRFDLEDPSYRCDTDDEYKTCYLASASGFPEITVPAGFTDDGLPIGLSFLGLPYSEPVLIGFAYAFEQATRARRPPPSTPLLQGGRQ